MADVLIRDVDQATLARIDAAANRKGVSRNTLLRGLLVEYARGQEEGGLSDDEVAAFGSSVQDLLDPRRRDEAWRR